MNPRVGRLPHFLQRTNNGLAVHEDRDSIANGKQSIQVVRNYHDRQVQTRVQIGREFIELGRGDRVETGCRLIEE
jgi:hypothetical protein